MDKALTSHIPELIGRWLDDKIERDMAHASPVGFYGLMNALTEPTPVEQTLLSALSLKLPGTR